MILSSPALVTDLAEALPATDHLTWTVLRRQLELGTSWAARVDGAIVALGGLVPVDRPGPPVAEGWFLAAPDAGRHIRPLVRAIRLTLAGAGHDRVVAAVRSAAGARLARACGFRPIATISGLELTLWLSSSAD